jgi:6-phosphogluconolactonase (cycloisomerase 2 family)
LTAYVGTYSKDGIGGVYRIEIDQENKLIKEPELFLDLDDAKTLSLFQGNLITSLKEAERCGIRWYEIRGRDVIEWDTDLQEKSTPCYIYQDHIYAATANYHDSCVTIYQKENGRLVLKKKIDFGKGAKCHQIFFYQGYFYIFCLGLDSLTILAEEDFTLVREILFPKGSGPRHGVISEKRQALYVVCELSNEVFTLDIKDGLPVNIRSSISVNPLSDSQAVSAAIRLSNDEEYVYVTVRGIKKIVVLRPEYDVLTICQIVDCGGDYPRDMILSQDMKYVLVANTDSGNICMFCVEDGLMDDKCCGHIRLERGSSIVLS